MDYCISKTIGFGNYSMDARWKIPAIYTIVEVLDFVFAESTSNQTRVFLPKRIGKILSAIKDNLREYP
ncbi:MAG TPA: hypothetical protein VJ111_10360 [Chitinophagaceae bacterium]|nr:hypothetical protein [Chitinophagaceae bacterium]